MFLLLSCYSVAIYPPARQSSCHPSLNLLLSLSCHCPNFFRTFSTKQSKTTKQSLDLCTPSKVQNTLTQGSLYCKSSCYPGHIVLAITSIITTLPFSSHMKTSPNTNHLPFYNIDFHLKYCSSTFTPSFYQLSLKFLLLNLQDNIFTFWTFSLADSFNQLHFLSLSTLSISYPACLVIRM